MSVAGDWRMVGATDSRVDSDVGQYIRDAALVQCRNTQARAADVGGHPQRDLHVRRRLTNGQGYRRIRVPGELERVRTQTLFVTDGDGE